MISRIKGTQKWIFLSYSLKPLKKTVHAAHTTSPNGSEGQISLLIDQIWAHITTLGTIEALTFISFGIVWLFYGWRVFKVLVVISFAMVGALIGFGSIPKSAPQAIAPGRSIAIVLGIVSIPLMRWSSASSAPVAGGL